MIPDIFLKDDFNDTDIAQVKKLLQQDITLLKDLSLYTLQKTAFANMLALVLRGETELTLHALKYLHHTNVEQCMRYWSDERKNNKEFMGKVIEKFAFAISDAGPDIRNDKHIVSTAFKQYYGYFDEASEELRHDTDFIISLLAYVPDHNINTLLQFCPKKIQDNKDVVLHFVKRNGYSLYYVSDRLKNDMQVVSAAVKNNYSSLTYASNQIRSNPIHAIDLLNINSQCFSGLSDALKGNYAVVLHAIQKDIHNIHLIDPKLKEEIGNNKAEEYLKYKIEYLKVLEFKEQLDEALPNKNLPSKKVKI